ncbi:alpha-amylase family protein [Thiohalophilus sp.]|uniref:alpha-amylase family protein n=1 Tax=Thiohalophilus sp. TaxID=3028392 RepID=UPI002ACF04B3|nr:alpha-amylase family protein [Thiohalophilus sp.]MDZ7660787.1 alpha-amylase family protein [Thiohalophilus sp.]
MNTVRNIDPLWLQKESATTLARLLPRLEAGFQEQVDSAEWEGYVERLKRHFPGLFERLYALYGEKYDFFYHLENILKSTTRMWSQRPDELRALDAMREVNREWYLSNRMVGAMCYVDLFAGDLQNLRARIPYLTELGITYLHLMPLFKMPEGDNDGGYAISSYREVYAPLGTMEDLQALATELRHHGISLVLDFILNHTSDEHDWAKSSLAGDADYQAYYRMYPDRALPDAYERSMGEIFPEDHPGAFTYRNRIKKWIWTTFNNYQWDLNYENPALFNQMLEEMLFLANQGVEILRLDAVAFLWKRLGTDCQNLPEAHWVIQAFNAIASIAAPAMVFKSEAIVHPDEVKKYIGVEECPLSYHPQLMALLWEALATRDVRVLFNAMKDDFNIPAGCAWINYVRSHDDIGWAFADEDVIAVDFDPGEHRRFLTDFYTGRYPGSFARGAPFQENKQTGDARISGTSASLCGLDKALEEKDEAEIELAIKRILLLHGVIVTLGGIPLLYIGDEIGTLNNQDYEQDNTKLGDTRWLHRSAFDWELAEQRGDNQSVTGRIYQGILRLIQLRQQNPAFDNAETEFTDSGNKHVFSFFRSNNQYSVFILANFSEHEQKLEARRLRMLGLRKTMVDLFGGHTITATRELVMAPYQILVLSRGA